MHEARIVVRAADVLEMRGLTEEPSADAAERIFALNGQHLTLQNGGGQTVADASFVHYVPSLRAISDATEIRDEVEDGVLFEGAHAYLDLRGGTLSAADNTVQEAVFTGGRTTKAQCVAMETTYTTRIAGDSVAFTGGTGIVLRLRAGAKARVINDPPPEFTTPHYHMYSMILKDATNVASPHATGQTCSANDREPRKGRFAVAGNSLSPRPTNIDLNCSSSTWP